MRSFSVVGLVALMSSAVFACSTHPSSVSALPALPRGPSPFIRQPGQEPNWIDFPQSGSIQAIAVGPDKNLWFTDCNDGQIDKMTMTGVETKYTTPISGGCPTGIISGPHSDLWFLEGSYIGRVTTSGQFDMYLIPIPNEQTYCLTLGPDRNIWFAEDQGGFRQQMIGRIRPDGKFLPPFNIGGYLGMVKGPDGRVWVTQYNAQDIFAVDSTGNRTIYGPLTEPAEHIVVGPDGNLWFNEQDYIGKITTSGAITEYSEPVSLGLTNLVVGADKHIWFTTYHTSYIGRVSLDGVSQYFQNPFNVQEFAMAEGPDKNIWWGGYQILGAYVRLVLTVQPSTIDFGSVGQTQTITVGEKKYGGSWTAASQNPAVATVNRTSNNTFMVTAAGSGSTSIDVADTTGNDVLVSVSVP